MRKKKTMLLSVILSVLLLFTPVYAEDFSDGSGFSDNPNTSTSTGTNNSNQNVPSSGYEMGGGYHSPIKLKKGKTVTAYICTQELAKLKVSGSKYKWTSSNKKVATVSSKGIVTAKKKGKTTITAKKGKTTYKCKLVVETPKLSNKTASIINGKTYQFKVSGTKQKVKWASSDSSIVSINSKGKATAKKAGTAFITAKVSTYEFSQSITVTVPATPTPTPKPSNSNTTTSTPVFNLGQTWTVPGQWRMTINSVTEMTERNPYSDKNPAAVYLIDYTYENLGYLKNGDGLFMSLGLYRYVDSQGYMGYTYPNSPTYYPEEIPIGAKCHAQECIGVNHKGNFKIYVDEYSDNGYSNSDKYSAIFNVTVN